LPRMTGPRAAKGILWTGVIPPCHDHLGAAFRFPAWWQGPAQGPAGQAPQPRSSTIPSPNCKGRIDDHVPPRPLLLSSPSRARVKCPARPAMHSCGRWSTSRSGGDHPGRWRGQLSDFAPQGQSGDSPICRTGTWYEYGMRVGFWRAVRALEEAKVDTPTMSLKRPRSRKTYPEAEVPRATPAGKKKVMAHFPMGQMPTQQIADKNRPSSCRQSIDSWQAKFPGSASGGSETRAAARMFGKLDNVAKGGLHLVRDWVWLDGPAHWVKDSGTARPPPPPPQLLVSITTSAGDQRTSNMMCRTIIEVRTVLLKPHKRMRSTRLYLESKGSRRGFSRWRGIPMFHRAGAPIPIISFLSRLYGLHQTSIRRGAIWTGRRSTTYVEAGAKAELSNGQGSRTRSRGGKPGCEKSTLGFAG